MRAGSLVELRDMIQAVQHVFTWLSGLPLRSRVDPSDAVHEPVRFGRVPLGDERLERAHRDKVVRTLVGHGPPGF